MGGGCFGLFCNNQRGSTYKQETKTDYFLVKFMNMLITQQQIRNRILSMAKEIDQHYADVEKPVVVLGVLAGAIFFMADLVRQMKTETTLDFIRVSTYPDKNTTNQTPVMIHDQSVCLEDADVLLVDDILDTGTTIEFIKQRLNRSGLNSLSVATLLRKPESSRIIQESKADFVGFDIPNKFVVGCGLDYDNKFRELSDIVVLEKINEYSRSKR